MMGRGRVTRQNRRREEVGEGHTGTAVSTLVSEGKGDIREKVIPQVEIVARRFTKLAAK